MDMGFGNKNDRGHNGAWGATDDGDQGLFPAGDDAPGPRCANCNIFGTVPAPGRG